MQILIVDPVATRPYCAETLQQSALGGTEATVVRVATGLARQGVRVRVAQRARQHIHVDTSGVEYIPYEHKRARPEFPSAGAVVVVRAHKVLPRMRRLYPGARLFLWMHCFPGRRLRGLARTAVETGSTVVAVSDYHRDSMREFYRAADPEAGQRLRLITIANPIDDALVPDGSPRDPDKLLFLSSPHKGLSEVAAAYHAVRRRVPSLRLYVGNPGYLDWPLELEGVQRLGALPHREAIAHLRSALCLFYPQRTFAETFGLVLAEANAVGTPVLAHPLGAAPEVLRDDEQLCDASDHVALTERILRWRALGVPQVSLPPHFRLRHVIERWLETLQPTRQSRVRTLRLPNLDTDRIVAGER